MIKQIKSIDGELAIKIDKTDKLKYGDIVNIEKIQKRQKGGRQ